MAVVRTRINGFETEKEFATRAEAVSYVSAQYSILTDSFDGDGLNCAHCQICYGEEDIMDDISDDFICDADDENLVYAYYDGYGVTIEWLINKEFLKEDK